MAAVSLYLLFCMLATLWFDASRYMIPNWISASLILLYPVMVFLSDAGVDWVMAMAGAGIVFAVGYGLFAMRWMGAGDIKFMTACSLWVGFAALAEYVFLVALLGGALSLILWGGRKIVPHVIKSTALPRIARAGEPVPYGLAISGAFLIFLAGGRIPGL